MPSAHGYAHTKNTDHQNDITRWSALIQQTDPTNTTACGSVREQHIACTGSHRASAALTSLQCDRSTKALDTPTMRWQQWDGDDDGDDDFAALDVDAPPMDEPARASGIQIQITHTRTHS